MTMALLAVNTVCVISTLACFEQLDEIAKLQQRISKYQAMSEKMKVEFKQVNDKWKKVQQLHDLWNYRTMPFLAIMGKIQNALDDKERSDDLQVEWLRRANDSLEILDEKLGLASDWTEAGQQPRTKEWKETIGRQLRNEEQREDVDELIHFLPMLTNPQLSMWSSFSTPDAGRA
ncbi:unnamed protein product [Prorocentrum cordatum]|uniref:Uncharacterized protein n=1 Tax=Prorocentrum cordatum TaxID=2364126 RepID=A0ABN9SSJ1_9DINO|nr:unnamed protein product [Polarella glacialis]